MRFITEDTNKGDVKDPLSLNLYTYCYGNPLKYYDPSGNTGELAAGWFGSMWWLLAADGPVPIGDAIYVIGGGLVYVGEALVTYGSQLVAAADKVKDKIGDNRSSGNQDSNNKNKGKPINLPSWKKIGIDMEHIISGHTNGGSRVSNLKTLFPERMDISQIEKAIRQAYRYGEKISTQGDNVLVRGVYDGLEIEMWVDTVTKTIETAYPIFR